MPANILIVEDEPAIQALIIASLKRAGHAAVAAGDAESAVRQINSALPDLILLDWIFGGLRRSTPQHRFDAGHQLTR